MEPPNMIFRYMLSVLFSIIFVNPLVIAVVGETTVNLTITTPEANRKEGGNVEMRCVATVTGARHSLAWTDESGILKHDTHITQEVSSRFIFKGISNTYSIIEEHLTITNLQRYDSGKYSCIVRVHESTSSGETATLVATSRIHLSVLYFPNETFPICFPKGPVTVDNGTQLNMRCSSEVGNPAVTMKVLSSHASPNNSTHYMWEESDKNNKILTQSINLIVETDDQGKLFACIISSKSFPDVNSTCMIGPLRVKNGADSTFTAKPMGTSLTRTSRPPSAVIAGASAGGAVALVFLILILIAICSGRLRCNIKQKRKMLGKNAKNSNLIVHSQPSESTICDYPGQNKSATSQSTIDLDQLQETKSSNPAPGSDTPPAAQLPFAGVQKNDSNQSDEGPNKANEARVMADDEAKIQHQHELDDGNSRQEASNAELVSDVSGDTSGLNGSTDVSTNPVASPMQKAPKKPAPYKSKACATGITAASSSNQDSQMSPEALATASQRPLDPDLISSSTPQEDGQDEGGGETNLPRPEEESDEVQVFQFSDRGEKPPPDLIVYADLDLQINPSDDSDHQPLPSEEATMYASITVLQRN